MWRRWLLRKRVLIPTGLLVLYALLGFLVVPRVVRSQLLQRLPVLLKRATTVGEVRFNPFLLRLEVDALEVQGRAGAPFVAFDRLLVDANVFQLVQGHVGFDAIRLERPRVSLSLLKDGSLSIADLVQGDGGDAQPAPEPQSGGGVTVVVRDFELVDGEATFNDLARAQPFSATLKPLSLHLVDFTTEAGRGSTYDFTARLGNAALEYSGTFSASPLRSSGKLSMKGIRLNAFTPYLREQTRFEVTSGELGVTGRYELDGSSPPLQFRLHDIGVQLDGLSVAGDDEPAPPFELGQLEVQVPLVDLTKREARVAEVVLRRGAVRVRRLEDGSLSLTRLAQPGGARTPALAQAVDAGPGGEGADAGATPSVAIVVHGAADGGTAPPARAAAGKGPPEPEAPPWQVSLGHLGLEQFVVEWRDAQPKTPVVCGLDGLSVDVRDVRWPLGGEVGVKVGFGWRDGGRLALEGRVTPAPLAADVKLDVTDFELRPLDGYVKESIEGTLKGAKLGASLTAKVDDRAGARTVRGDVRLTDLAVLDADDQPFLDAREIALAGLAASLGAAVDVQAASLKLAGVTAHLEVDANGSLNASRLVKPPPAGAAPPPAPPPTEPGAAEPHLALAALELSGVNVTWLDRSTTPDFAAALNRVGGKVTRVSYPVQQKMGVALAGRVDAAPLKINGAVRPNGKDSVAAVTLTLDGYDLPRATPYSVKYVAQPIEKGKLSLDLRYSLQQRALDAQNKVIVDQLEFGERVPEPDPDAASLPLGLAVAILSDRNGRIDVDLPITGDLNEPEFHYGQAVVATLKNLLVKVATAPFSLLAGLAGGDAESMSSVAFVPGQAVLAAGEDSKLEQLAKVLGDRPKLKLDLLAGVDPVVDREALSRVELRRQLARTARGPGGAQLDGGVAALTDDATYEGLVRQAWRKARGPTDAGVAPEPSFGEMEAQLAAKLVVSEDSLEDLRRARGAFVQGALADRGVDAVRVFLLQPDAAHEANARASVEFHPR